MAGPTHPAEFENFANMVKRPWQDIADLAIQTSLKYSQLVVYNLENDTYCLNATIEAKRDRVGGVLFCWRATVVIGESGRRVITAYASNRWCRVGQYRQTVDDNRPF